ncbi:MAG: hypothetical protein H6624_13475 [Bdellovibrionaceae bacterium]|nr:hypothetical protein [Bdellovibrionales bacterium]MCB9085353.1 hypothetical protein [Pseudobdellovibrionaceae bacterium]
MKKVKHIAKKLWNDESGQGATEYILLLVVVVALVMIFRPQIEQIVNDKLGQLSSAIGGFNPN